MICAKCGREMPDTDRFCGICGTLNRRFDNPLPVPEHTGGQESDMPAREYTRAQESALPAQEITETQTDDAAAQSSTDAQTTDLPVTEVPEADFPVPDFAAGIHTSVARVQGPTPQPGVMPPPGYRPYVPADSPTRKEKVKRTCSLSVVIFCGIVIFLLSVLCGVFAGLYFSVKPAAAIAPHSITEYMES